MIIAAVVIARVIGKGEISEARYYLWRLQKANTTPVDRFRAIEHLEELLPKRNAAYAKYIRKQLTCQLRFEMLPVDTADRILKLLLNRSLSTGSPAIIEELADALRTGNSDLRFRTEKELVYLADEHRLPIPAELRGWKPDKEDSPTCIDTVANIWAEIAKTNTAPQAGSLACLAGTPPVVPERPSEPKDPPK
jgi:hypothetical protein